MKRMLGLVLVSCAAAACNTGDASNPVSYNAGDGKGTLVELGGLKSQTPPEWEKEKATGLRHLQFRVPHADNDPEDAELVVFYFDGSGGGLEDNLKRWKQKFIAPKGKTIDEVLAAHSTSEYDARVPNSQETTERFVRQLYAELRPAELKAAK